MRGPSALLVASAAAVVAGCAVKQPASEGAGYFPDRTWRTSTPEEQGIDSTSLVRMLEEIRGDGLGIDGIVVVRHGHLVLESYLAPYHADTLHNLKSSSKSILSALVGIALREKVLEGLDQRVSELLPERFTTVDDPRKKDITLRHLLTMTAGLAWEENGPAADRLWQGRDWVGAAIALPLAEAPGERFTYSTALTHLASAAIARRSGMSTRAFAERYLLDPVGIHAGPWRRDPQGIHWGGTDLFLTPRDMARFGYLYLHGGAWNGRQVVPREWVAESTRAQVRTGGWGGIDDYGYWWWIDPDVHIAMGRGGQVIAVVPAQDLVVVFTGACPESVPFALFRKHLAPAIRPARLPPNPAAERSLSRLVRELERPPALPAPPIPEAAGRLAGRTFRLEPNPLGFTGLRIRCAAARDCSLELEASGRWIALPVGLDGRYRVATGAGLGDLPVACKGAWVDPGPEGPAFLLSLVQVGDPVRTEARFTFEGGRVSISVVQKGSAVQAIRLEGAG